MSEELGVLVQNWVLQVMGISTLLLVGWMALAKLKKTATETQRNEVKEDRKWTMQREGNFYP